MEAVAVKPQGYCSILTVGGEGGGGTCALSQSFYSVKLRLRLLRRTAHALNSQSHQPDRVISRGQPEISFGQRGFWLFGLGVCRLQASCVCTAGPRTSPGIYRLLLTRLQPVQCTFFLNGEETVWEVTSQGVKRWCCKGRGAYLSPLQSLVVLKNDIKIISQIKQDTAHLFRSKIRSKC